VTLKADGSRSTHHFHPADVPGRLRSEGASSDRPLHRRPVGNTLSIVPPSGAVFAVPFVPLPGSYSRPPNSCFLRSAKARELAAEFGGIDRLSVVDRVLIEQAAALLVRKPHSAEDAVRAPMPSGDCWAP
jgi:hypothetical protein